MDLDATLQRIRCFVENCGKVPTFEEIQKEDGSLAYLIAKHGGYQKCKKLLGFIVDIRRSPNYWSDWRNLEGEIKKLIAGDRFPTVEEIKSSLGNGAYKATLKLGGIDTVAKKMGFKTTSALITSDGHHVKSSYEFLFDEYLYSNKIPHEVGGFITPSKPYRYDFKIGEHYVEIWGFGPANSRGPNYIRKRRVKEKLYADLGLSLISIEFSDFQQSHSNLHSFLDRLARKFGFSPDPDFNVRDHINHTKHWSYETTLDELKALSGRLDVFPSFEDMESVPGLRYAVSKHGGVNRFRKELGYELRNRWTDQAIRDELNRMTKELGRVPKTTDLKNQRKWGLLTAILDNGGMNNFRN